MKYFLIALAAVATVIPNSTLAASIKSDGTGGDMGAFITTTLSFITDTIIPFILGIAFLFFVWGIFLYFIKGGHSDDDQEKGRSYIVSSVIGFVIILSFWGIVTLLSGGIGLDKGAPAKVPTTTFTPAT